MGVGVDDGCFQKAGLVEWKFDRHFPAWWAVLSSDRPCDLPYIFPIPYKREERIGETKQAEFGRRSVLG